MLYEQLHVTRMRIRNASSFTSTSGQLPSVAAGSVQLPTMMASSGRPFPALFRRTLYWLRSTQRPPIECSDNALPILRQHPRANFRLRELNSPIVWMVGEHGKHVWRGGLRNLREGGAAALSQRAAAAAAAWSDIVNTL